mgnify:CR=1 FL=1
MRKSDRKRVMAILMAVSCVFSFAGCQEKMEEYDAKPVIYLYPESKTDVTVKLDYAGELTCTIRSIRMDGRLRPVLMAH